MFDFCFCEILVPTPGSFKCSERHMTHETAFCLAENMANIFLNTSQIYLRYKFIP